jgi:hypothetical protein
MKSRISKEIEKETKALDEAEETIKVERKKSRN